MNYARPFAPHYGSTQTVTPAAASASVTLSMQDAQVRILNTGANIAFIRVGSGSVTATAADFPIAPGQAATITKGVNSDVMAHISAAGTTLIITTGNGL